MKKVVLSVVVVLLLSAFVMTAAAGAVEVADPYGSHIVNDHASAASANNGDNAWHNPGVMHRGKSGW